VESEDIISDIVFLFGRGTILLLDSKEFGLIITICSEYDEFFN
jgi:hypothetical protein